MLVNIQFDRDINFENYRALNLRYGAKAAGLSMLPAAWRIAFAALSIDTHEYWLQHGVLATAPEIIKLERWFEDKKVGAVIVRSSGVDEALYDRGKFRSVVLQAGWKFSEIEEAVIEVFKAARAADPKAKLGIVVQEHLKPIFAGHLSNEHRVSPTINQWSYELERPNWAPAKGLNSKFTTSPDPMAPLECGNQIPHQPLRSVAHFLASEFKQRCHLEWLVHRSNLYLVQIDFEWPEHDRGLNPRKDIRTSVPPELNLDCPTSLKPYQPGRSTKWPKLKNLTDFDFGPAKPFPKIYPLSPARVRQAFCDTRELETLKAEMVALTGNRLVVRTDCVQKGIESFNLPRTDTKNVVSALDWCRAKVAYFEEKGINEQNFIFLFHAFLPALASAWAYARPGDPTVIIDALWGLPDGLQVLPVDTYEVNVAQNKVVQTKSTFKPKFLTELEDGTWDYCHIKSRFGRSQVLSLSDKLEIARRTKEIAEKIHDEAQIMWFCGIPDEYRVGRNMPWFRSRERLDPSPRQEVHYRPFIISKPEDLDRLPGEKVTIQLLPEANLIRDENFLDKIVEVALQFSLPVQLQGSILGHAYYRLSQSGVTVALSNSPKYYRSRQKKVFGKIVRDKIPANIAAGGETVREARLAKADLSIGLAGKILEELEELLRASPEQRAEELSDVFEVLRGLAKAYSISWSSVVTLAKDKAAKRGGFSDGRVLIETALPHHGSPLEREEQVRIADLGRVNRSSTHVEIPSSSLLATARGPGVIFSFEEDTSRFRVAIRQGKLFISKLDGEVPAVSTSQRDLFEDN